MMLVNKLFEKKNGSKNISLFQLKMIPIKDVFIDVFTTTTL